LKGLSPKQNREIPPLDYDRVYLLKQEFPLLHVSINGGIKTLTEIKDHLGKVDGVMIGREAYKNPFSLIDIDSQVFADESSEQLSRKDILAEMKAYIMFEAKRDVTPRYITRHMMGLFHGQPGASEWRKRFAAGQL